MKIGKHVIAVVILFGATSLLQYGMLSFAESNQIDYDTYNKMEDSSPLLNQEFFENEVLKSEQTATAEYELDVCENMKVSLLKPVDWFLSEESNTTSSACFISSTELTEESPTYETGLTINVIKNASEQLPVPPKEFVSTLLDEVGQVFEEVEPYQILQSSDSPLYAEVTTMYSQESTVYFANYWNQDTDTVYLISFESPSQSWEESWTIAEPIVTSLDFEPTY